MRQTDAAAQVEERTGGRQPMYCLNVRETIRTDGHTVFLQAGVFSGEGVREGGGLRRLILGIAWLEMEV